MSGVEHLDEIDIKLAFLERANSELSEVVYRQQREIDALRARLTALAARFDESQSEQAEFTPDEERPPHY